MRVLLAIDGSDAAWRAVTLVSTSHLPANSLVRVVAVVHEPSEMMGLPLVVPPATRGAGGIPGVSGDATERASDEIRWFEDALENATSTLRLSGIRAERLLLHGRPASAIVDEAKAMAADLIVVGSRGLGRFQRLLLGSVSSEIVDHAKCPVLVVRHPRVRGIVLAVDGSACGKRAAEFLASSGLGKGQRVSVVSVADVALPWEIGLGGGYGPVLDSYEEDVSEARNNALAIARQTAEGLQEAGLDARYELREGDVTHGILEATAANEANLIVTGTRGHAGVARLLLGSVARKVLLHADASVLIVRQVAHSSGEGPLEEERATGRERQPTAV